eukprot:scaffold12909_cov133-Skeletonema_marinoi.AAC.7
MALLKSVALASLVGSTSGEMIRITPIMLTSLPQPSMGQSPHQCPLRVLRDSIRSHCDIDAKMKCPTTTPDFPLFFSQQQQQHSPFSSSGFMSFPAPPSIGMGSFDDLESVIDELFSSTLQIFDEAMSANSQFAEERAVEAFDAKLPSFVEEIVSSASSSSSSDEEEIDNVPPQEDVFASLLGDITDITQNIHINSERRRLSEGENSDLHLEMKDRLARRLTEYVSRTEVFQLPGGGVMRVVSLSQVDETPRLGLGDVEVDGCIYSSYKNGDLSSGCAGAVSSYMNFINARRSGLEHKVQQTPIQNSLPAPAAKADDETLQTLSGIHQQYINKDDSTLRIAMIATAIFLGPVYMLAVLAVMIILDQFYPSDDDEEEEGTSAVDFDYVKMEEDNDAADQMDKPRVFIGVPVQS